MKRLRRGIRKGLTALSLLLCLATVAIWLRSYGNSDFLFWYHVSHDPAGQKYEQLSVGCDRGGIFLSRNGFRMPPEVYEQNPGNRWPDGWTLEPSEPKWGSSGQYPYRAVGVGTPEAFRFAGFQLTTGFRPDPKDRYARHDASLVAPLWAITLLLAIAPARVLIRRLRSRGQPPSSARPCPACRYDLTGNVSGVCPECGTAVAKGVA